jgi:hypothetical protein
MATLAEIRAKLLAQDKKAETNANQSQGSNALYPFWNMEVDSTAVVRFLPDADATNDFFWRERQIIKLPFSGIKGIAESKPITIQVPCVEMWGDQCPIHAEIRPWYKDPSMEKLASQYWKKRSYIFQGFVVTNPIDEKDAPENPIRRFIISPQIFKILKGALMDPDMETVPTDYDSGTDFRLLKTQNGQYADYGTSNWARKERSLNELERAAIEQYGLNDLNDFMPKKPNAEELAAMVEMFEASVDGELYDPARWANFYRPYGVDLGEFNPKSTSNNAGSTGQAAAPSKKEPAPAPEVDDEIPFDSNEEAAAKQKAASVSSPSKPKQDASDILAMIRQRKAD